MPVNINVRWSDNTADLARNLKLGEDVIDSTRASAEKMAQSLGGDKLIAAANRYAAAIDLIGGAEKLTDAERERGNALLEKALEKYDALGRTAPQAIRELAEATRAGSEQTGVLGGAIDRLLPSTHSASEAFTGLKGVLGDAFDHPTVAAQNLAGIVGGELLTALGTAGVAVGVVGGALVAAGGAALELGEKAAHVGANLNDMSDKTGIAVPVLSRLSAAAQVAGTDINTLTNGVFKMQAQIAEDSPKVQAGVHRIGVSFDELQALSPDQQLEKIADGLRNTVDPAERSAAAQEIFGKQGRDLLPTLLKLNDAMAITAGITPFTEQEAKQAEEFEMKVAALRLQFDQFAVDLGRDVLPALSTLLNLLPQMSTHLLKGADSGMLFDLVVKGWKDQLHGGEAALDMLQGKLVELPTVTGKGADAIHNLSEAGQAEIRAELGIHDAMTANAVAMLSAQRAEKDLEAQHRVIAEAAKKAAEEHQKFEDSLNNVILAERGYQGTLDDLDGTVVEAIRFDLQHKAAIEDVARVYGVEKEQVKLVQEQLKAENEQAKQNAEDQKKLYAELMKVENAKNANTADWIKQLSEAQRKATEDTFKADSDAIDATDRLQADHYRRVLELSGHAMQAQIADVEEWARREKAKYADASEFVKRQYYDAIEATARDKIQKIIAEHSVLFSAIERITKDITSKWETTFAETLVKTGSFKDAAVAVWDDMKKEVVNIAAQILDSWIKGLLDPWLAAVEDYAAKIEKKILDALIGGADSAGQWWDQIPGAPGHGGGGSPGGGSPGGGGIPGGPPEYPGPNEDPGHGPGYPPSPDYPPQPPTMPKPPGGPGSPPPNHNFVPIDGWGWVDVGADSVTFGAASISPARTETGFGSVSAPLPSFRANTPLPYEVLDLGSGGTRLPPLPIVVKVGDKVLAEAVIDLGPDILMKDSVRRNNWHSGLGLT